MFGLVEAAQTWPEVAVRDWIYMIITLFAAVLAGIVIGVKKRGHWLRWPVLAWSRSRRLLLVAGLGLRQQRHPCLRTTHRLVALSLLASPPQLATSETAN